MENNTLVENSIITKDVMDTLDFERLDAKAQGEILKMKESLDVSSTESIMQFGNTASKNITSMSKEMLGAFKMNDIPEVAQLLPTLTNAFDQVDTQSLLPKKKSWFSRIGKSSGVSNFVQKFETVEQVVQGIQKNLQQAYFEIQRDIETEKRMGQKNLEFIQQLDYAIFAIKMAYKEELEKVEMEEAQLNKEDVLAAHLVQEHRDQVTCIDRQIYSLSCQRVQAIQTLPILRTIIDGNIGLSSNINPSFSYEQ